MSAENGMMLGMDDLMNPPDVDLLPAGNYPVTIKNGLFKEDTSLLLLFCTVDHGTDKDIDDVTAFLNFPCELDSKREQRDKSNNIMAWIKAAGLTPETVEELIDPQVWIDRQISADITIRPAKGDRSASNNIKNVNTIA